jgi:hypothetical protein
MELRGSGPKAFAVHHHTRAPCLGHGHRVLDAAATAFTQNRGTLISAAVVNGSRPATRYDDCRMISR